MAQLERPFRIFNGVVTFMVKRGIGPTLESMLAQPEAKRRLSVAPFFARRPGDRTLTVYEKDVNDHVRVRVYVKPGTQPGSPAILYIHGGGFFAGGPDNCDYITRGLASRTGLPVISVDYRLAPETPFPGPLEDCEDALRWLVETKPEGIDPTRIAIAGDSAGGNLTAALTLKVRESGPKLVHQTLIYPFTDGSITSPDWDTYAIAGIGRDAGHFMMRTYAPNHPIDEPLVSVLHAPDHTGLPPATVITAEHDTLNHDGIAYADKLRAAGVPVVAQNFEGVPHAFMVRPRMTKQADVALDLVAAEITAALS